MNTAIHLWSPDPPAPLPGPTVEPVPLLREELEQTTLHGDRVDHIILWRNEDAARCNWCPASRCTFNAGPLGQGVCVVRQPSHEAQARPLFGG